MAEERSKLTAEAWVELARAALKDEADYRSPRGTMTSWDDQRVGRMLAREPELARIVLQLLDDKRDLVEWWAVEVERQRQRLRSAAVTFCSRHPGTEELARAAEELEIAASVFTRAEMSHAEALEDAGFGHCETCGELTKLEDLHLYYEDIDAICPACLAEAEQEQQERAVSRAARKRRRKLS